MTIQAWLLAATQQLEAAGIGTARLDALVLLEDAMGVNRAMLLARPEQSVPHQIENVLIGRLKLRSEHIPLAYIRGKTEFYGRQFIISSAVLEPRPESETMIELLLKRTDLPRKLRIADVGTGSGALGITAEIAFPNASVDLLDIDSGALDVAKRNVIKFTSGAHVIQSDLLRDTKGDYDVLLCNLPYVPDDHRINEAAMHEPALAIFGGADGLDLYRKLFLQLQKVEKEPLLILTESLPPQHEALKQLAEAQGYIQDAEDDFIQAFVPES
jgi:release factor glutamine methyltransferase